MTMFRQNPEWGRGLANMPLSNVEGHDVEGPQVREDFSERVVVGPLRWNVRQFW